MLSAAAAEEVVRRFYGALVAHDWAAVERCLHPEVVWSGVGAELLGLGTSGRDAVLSFLRTGTERLPGWTIEVDRVATDGSSAVVTGRHVVPLPDGSRRELALAHFVRLRDGRLAEVRSQVDSTRLLDLYRERLEDPS